MGIIFDKENMVFNLQTPNTSYVIGIYENKLPIHIHYGRRIENTAPISDLMDYSVNIHDPHCPDLADFNETVCLSALPLEFPTYGNGDYRTPIFHAIYKDGSSISNLYYLSHKITKGKIDIPDLPSTYVENEAEAETLEIILKDALTELEVVLYYTAFNDRDVITRSIKIINKGKDLIKLQNVLSGCIDIIGKEFDFIQFSGEWTRERHIEKTALRSGIQSVESLKGISSHQNNPFVCLASKNADEDTGEVYGMNLVYSGNFVSGAYLDNYNRTRLYTGINPFNFEWRLSPNETFNVPECVMVYSDCGFGKLSRTYHSLVNERVCRGVFRDKERPILINNWEATYFDFDEEKILNIAKKASELGVELLVLDDGWFGTRNDDKSSLGDWVENKEKLPNGIEGLAKNINDLGMKFGLWIEPEMISPISKLYEQHPDWCLHVENRSRNLARNQLILDLSNNDVCNYIIETLSNILNRANVEYIKWDMNRNLSDVGSGTLPSENQLEVAHRYVLGLYKILDTIKKKFPNVLFEGCCGGGGRFDLGMLCYFDQYWTSDDTEAVERQYIQTGTSFAYPMKVMGAHVSAVPNHQIGRVTDIKTRGYVALPGQFGYELDLNNLSEDEINEVKNQIKLYKEYGHVFHNGDMYRISSPFESNYTVWEFVSKDKKTVIVFIGIIKGMPKSTYTSFKLKELDNSAVYVDSITGNKYYGEHLMSIGLIRTAKKDFDSELLILQIED